MEQTDKRYLKAIAEANSLDDTNPLKLSLVLNYAVYKYEVEQNFEQAIDIANTAFYESLQLYQTLDAQD